MFTNETIRNEHGNIYTSENKLVTHKYIVSAQ